MSRTIPQRTFLKKKDRYFCRNDPFRLISRTQAIAEYTCHGMNTHTHKDKFKNSYTVL